jgi:hypothetical protein
MLPAGTYLLKAPVNGQLAPGSLFWTMQCLKANALLAELPVDPATPGGQFTIPNSGCDAQWLRLQGRALEMPQQSDVTIGPAQIGRVGG